MKQALPLILLLLAATLGGAVAQSWPGSREPMSRGKGEPTTGAKGGVEAPSGYAPITTRGAEGEERAPALVPVNKIKLKKPVLVYYKEATPGKSVHQLIMSEANLSLLKTLYFTSNGLPGINSVRAVYTLRKTEAAERGAGSGETIH